MKKLGPFLLLVLVLAVLFRKTAAPAQAFSYFTLQCSLFDRDGHLLFYKAGFDLCAYAPDGKLLVSKPNEDTLTLFSADDTPLWTAREHAHHDLKFTSDNRGIMAITSEVTGFRGAELRSDCVSLRNLENRVLHRWCLSEHLAELEQNGFRFDFPQFAAPPNRSPIAFPTHELSHANSFYRIGKNSRSEKNPAFREGNYIVNLYEPSFAVLILDPELKRVLWSRNFSRFHLGLFTGELHTHDIQVTAEGDLLIYANNFVPDSPELPGLPPFLGPVNLWPLWHSRLLEWDPETDQVRWMFTDDPPARFQAPRLGSVNRLANGHYVYSDASSGGDFFEITRDGKRVWNFSPATDRKRRKFAPSIRPFTDTGFLKARGLL